MFNPKTKRERRLMTLAAIRAQVRAEITFTRRSAPLLVKQIKTAAQIIRDTGDIAAAEGSVDQAAPQWDALLKDRALRIGAKVAKQVYKDLKWEHRYFFLERKNLEAFIEYFRGWVFLRTAQKVKRINQTTKYRIGRIVDRSVMNGLGNHDIAKNLVDFMVGAGSMNARLRCRTIARTETHQAYNFTAKAAVESTGYETLREWGPAEDDRTRPTHAEMVLHKWIRQDEYYQVGSCKLAFPGDPSGDAEETINCRCTEYFHTQELMKRLTFIFPQITLLR